MHTSKPGFRADIEGLRAIAVLLVMAFHAQIRACGGGFIGVDVFFVLSGYLITGLLRHEIVRTNSIDLTMFYSRRLRRLLPASTVMVLGSAFVSSVLLPPLEQSHLAMSSFATLTYLSNVYFARLSSSYFARDMSAYPLLHTWSLSVEEQFYLVWPLLILVVYHFNRSRRFLCNVMSILGVISLAVCIWLTRSNQPYAFYLTPLRAWAFAAGGLASQIQPSELRSKTVTLRIAGWLGLAGIIMCGFFLSPAGFPGIKAVLPVLATVMVLIAGSVKISGGVDLLLNGRVLQYIGSRSYALYLWHWPLLVFASVLWDPFVIKFRILAIATSFLLAELTHRFVENPIRFSSYLQKRAPLCVAGSFVIIVAGTGGAFLWRVWAKHTPNYVLYGTAMEDTPEDTAQNCLVPFGVSKPGVCSFGDPNSRTTIVLFGDSHVEQWLPAFHTLADVHHWRVLLLVKGACPALAIETGALQAAGPDHWCQDWRKQSIQMIRAMHPDLVVLSNATGYPEVGSEVIFQSPLQWQNGARQTFEQFHDAGFPVVFLRDTPWTRFEAIQCLARYAWNGLHPCPQPVRDSIVEEATFQAQKSGSIGLPNVAFLDMTDEICNSMICPLTKNGMIVYRDRSSHITATFSRSLSTAVYKRLLESVPQLRATVGHH